MTRRADWVSWGLVALCASVAIARARGPRAVPAQGNPQKAAQLARVFALGEAKRRLDAARAFPGDLWSQDDDFHHQEERWIHDEASHAVVSVDDLLFAIDQGLRDRGPAGGSKASAAPCKPRPLDD